MSRAIGQHMKTIREQRQILQDWTAYEYDLDAYFKESADQLSDSQVAWMVSRGFTPLPFPEQKLQDAIERYHQNLDVAEIRLKTAASRGGVVDITNTRLGHDLRCVRDPTVENPEGDKLRIRANLVRMDFYERFGRAPETHTYKLTIPHIVKPKKNAPIADLALAIQVPRYEPVVLASFADATDAMLYRLAIQ